MSSGAIQQRQTQMGALVPVDQRTSAGPKKCFNNVFGGLFYPGQWPHSALQSRRISLSGTARTAI